MIELSEIDRLRFGPIVAKADIASFEDLKVAETFCADKNVELLIARIPAAELPVAQALMQAGGLLTDTLFVFQRDLNPDRAALASPPPPPDGIMLRGAKPDDAARVGEIARVAYHGYLGHYHCDPRLDPAACDEVYADWASRSCTDRLVADRTLVAELAGKIVAFMGFRILSAEETTVTVSAVAPPGRGRNLHRLLVRHHLARSAELGAARMLYATQTTNLPVLRTAVRDKFELRGSYYTIHKWFDDPDRHSARRRDA